jgi:hypothetical protein
MKNLIDYASQDNGTDFRDALYSAIHDKVSAHIEAKKQEIASGLMGQQFEEEVELEEETESLDEISTDLVNKYTDKAQKSYASADTSPEKKANRRTGLMTGYRKLKATAKVPATYGEEVELIENHVDQFSKETGLSKAHAQHYASGIAKYPNNDRAAAEHADNAIQGPRMKVKFHQSPSEYQDKKIAHVKTMKGIMGS